jgi:hypothetical protein
MTVLGYPGSQCKKFHAAGWMCQFPLSFYLETCIWPDMVSALNFVQITEIV